MSTLTETRRAARVPPHDVEAEESLLGAMLLTPDAITTAAAILDADAFYKPAHAHIYQAATTLHRRGQPVDPVTITDHLTRTGHLEAAGGPGTLISLQAATPATGNAARYARIVEELARLRRMIGAANEIAELAYTAPDDVDGAVDRAEQLIYSLGRSGVASATRRLDTVIHTVLEELVARAERGEQIDGIPTGWADLDALLLGLSPGDVTIIGARPAMGKSQLAAVLAWQVAAETGRPVLFASLEMKAEELAKRWLGTGARVPLQHIRRAKLDDDEWAQINASIASYTAVPVHILDNYGATVGAIAHAGRRIGLKDGLIIIDYAQLITPGAKGENRNVEVSEVSRAVKLMAGNLGCHVILLSQLSRQLEQRSDKRPVLSDLRDSGSLEQDASNVLFLYRDEVYKGTKSKARGILEIIVSKQRNGPQGTVELFYRPSRGQISNIAFRTTTDQEI